MSELPEQTTKLLMRLCTDYHPTILAENDGKAQKANFVPPSAEMSTAAASSTGTFRKCKRERKKMALCVCVCFLEEMCY